MVIPCRCDYKYLTISQCIIDGSLFELVKCSKCDAVWAAVGGCVFDFEGFFDHVVEMEVVITKGITGRLTK